MPTKDELQADLNDAHANIEKLEAKVAGLSEDLNAAGEENERLTSAVKAANASGADPELQNKLDAVIKENDEMKARLGERSDADIAAAEAAAGTLEEAIAYETKIKGALNVARGKLNEYDQKESLDTGSLPLSKQISQARQTLVKRVNDLKAEHAIAKDQLSAAKDAVNPDLAAA
jgi:chromosome segregation ATPase